MRLMVVDINLLPVNESKNIWPVSKWRESKTKAIYTPYLLINTKPESICPQYEVG